MILCGFTLLEVDLRTDRLFSLNVFSPKYFGGLCSITCTCMSVLFNVTENGFDIFGVNNTV